MNRKLVLLNAVLAAVVVYGGVQLRDAYKAEKAREAALKAEADCGAAGSAVHAAGQRCAGAALRVQLRGAEESVSSVARSECAGGIAAAAASAAAHAGPAEVSRADESGRRADGDAGGKAGNAGKSGKTRGHHRPIQAG